MTEQELLDKVLDDATLFYDNDHQLNLLRSHIEYRIQNNQVIDITQRELFKLPIEERSKILRYHRYYGQHGNYP